MPWSEQKGAPDRWVVANQEFIGKYPFRPIADARLAQVDMLVRPAPYDTTVPNYMLWTVGSDPTRVKMPDNTPASPRHYLPDVGALVICDAESNVVVHWLRTPAAAGEKVPGVRCNRQFFGDATATGLVAFVDPWTGEAVLLNLKGGEMTIPTPRRRHSLASDHQHPDRPDHA